MLIRCYMFIWRLFNIFCWLISLYSSDHHLVFIWCQSDSHLICNWCSSDIHLICIWCSSDIHLKFIQCSSNDNSAVWIIIILYSYGTCLVLTLCSYYVHFLNYIWCYWFIWIWFDIFLMLLWFHLRLICSPNVLI